MAEELLFELEIPPDLDVLKSKLEDINEVLQEEAETIQKVNEQLEDNTDETKNNSNSWKSWGESIGKASVYANQFLELAGKIYDAFVSASEEYARQTGILESLGGSIDEASRRLSGMVAEIDLMETRNKIAQSGLALTSHEFANVAVAAEAYGAAIGGDTVQAMEQLTKAIQSGSLEQLRRFGIEVEQGATRAEIQEQAIAQLERRYGTVTAEVANSADVLDRMKASMENANTAFIRGMEASTQFEQSLSNLGDSVTDLLGEDIVGWAADWEMWGATVDGILSGVVNYINSFVTGLQAAKQELLLFLSGDIEGALQAYQERIASSTNRSLIGSITEGLEGAAQDLVNSRAEQAGQARLQDLMGEVDALIRQIDAADEQWESERSARESSQSAARQAQEQEWAALMLTLQDEEIASIQEQMDLETIAFEQEQFRANYEQEAARQRAIMQLEEIERNKVIEAQQIQKTKLIEQQMRQQELLQSKLSAAGQQISTVTGKIIDNVMKGNMNVRDAIKSALDEWLKGFAIQETLKGAAALAEAVGMTIFNPPGAAAKYAEAGQHFAVAAAAGVASLAIPNASSGGGASATGTSSETSSSTPTTNPEGGASATPGVSQGPVTIVINTGLPLATDADIGRAVINAQQAYNIRYGNV
jgi:hypothetical protein